MSLVKENDNVKYVDHLTEDPPIPGQLWCCVSFLSPEGIKNCSLRGLKIRGVFGTKQEADKKAEELQKLDPDFHVFVGEVGKWLPWDPEPSSIEDNKYQEEELNNLMKGYKDNLEKSKQLHDERVKTEIAKAKKEQEEVRAKRSQAVEVEPTVDNVLDPHNSDVARDKLRKKLEEKRNRQNAEKTRELQKSEAVLKHEEELLKAEKAHLDEVTEQAKQAEANLGTIDDKLAKIQELYAKLNKK